MRILAEWGTPLIKQLIEDSGIEEFRNAITHYLTHEKRPELFKNLVVDLQPLCISLKNITCPYTENWIVNLAKLNR